MRAEITGQLHQAAYVIASVKKSVVFSRTCISTESDIPAYNRSRWALEAFLVPVYDLTAYMSLSYDLRDLYISQSSKN